jgi:hypothetical protein
MRLRDTMSEKAIEAAEKNVFLDESRTDSGAVAMREAFARDLNAQEATELAEGLSESLGDAISAQRENAGGLSPFYTTKGRALRNGGDAA